MYNLNWSRPELSKQKLGTFGEYYAKMTLASYGMSIYTSEVDDHGIDFIAETKKGFLKFQVKTIRTGSDYVFMKEKYFDISDDSLYLLLIILDDGAHPDIYVIPTSAWKDTKKTMFVHHTYEGKKSEPEYGVNLSKKNMHQLEAFDVENFINNL